MHSFFSDLYQPVNNPENDDFDDLDETDNDSIQSTITPQKVHLNSHGGSYPNLPRFHPNSQGSCPNLLRFNPGFYKNSHQKKSNMNLSNAKSTKKSSLNLKKNMLTKYIPKGNECLPPPQEKSFADLWKENRKQYTHTFWPTRAFKALYQQDPKKMIDRVLDKVFSPANNKRDYELIIEPYPNPKPDKNKPKI